MKIGIDKIGFYAPQYYLEMKKLAEARQVDPNKYIIGIGQDQMAVVPPTQDSVTLGANAALAILDEADRNAIDLVIFATESGIDQSKSGAVYLHHLLDLKPETRALEIKQACYGGTSALQLAKGHIALHPESKALIVSADIARYGLNTGGEVTQGAGAVAMLVTNNPKVLALNNDEVYLTEDIMDFWRPNYAEYAQVEGKYSSEKYIDLFNQVWLDYTSKTGKSLADFKALVFHLPFTKMGKKALSTILEGVDELKAQQLLNYYQLSTLYNRQIGNIYTGSLFLSLISLLEKSDNLKSGDQLGLFSYGSGAVGEFFTGELQPDFKKYLFKAQHEELLAARQEINVETYEKLFNSQLPTDGSTLKLAIEEDSAPVVLAGIEKHQRLYRRK